MNTDNKGERTRAWLLILLATVVGVSLALGLFTRYGALRGQTRSPLSPAEMSSVFTPAHRSMGEALRHFLGLRPEPVQPLPYTHKVHIEVADLSCDFCHDSVAKGPVARIPSVDTCMICHEDVATEHPAIQLLTSYYERREEVPWQRVYGWYPEAHVRFNHAPHIRAGVECATCHGDVAEMTVAERVVDHTMGFCINCHKQEGASNDCMTCHY